MKPTLRALLIGCGVFSLANLPQTAQAVDYDEAVDGDLSDDRFAPTPFLLEPGSNQLTATSTSGDIEYFYAPVPAGHELSAIVMDSYSLSFGFSFIGVQAGTTFTEPADSANPGNLLGYHLFGIDDVGNDILDDMGMGQGSMTFTPPLAAGDYTFWSQETAASFVPAYSFDFIVTPVPESGLSSWWFLVISLGIVTRSRSNA